jgi:Type ISP C-terminal specificity domain
LAANYLKDVSADAPDLFFHALAILHSTAYRTEHASALRQNFPRLPLPAKLEDLQSSAALGKRIAALLDTETGVANVTTGKLDAPFASIGALAHSEGLQLQASDFEITAGWGHAGKGGVTMPAKGKLLERDYTETEIAALTLTAARLGLSLEDVKETLGQTTFDIYLNNSAYWRNIPRNVWEYTIGGYQVLKKWLSYRETELLKRALTLAEANETRDTARRIAAILLSSNDLDKNYLTAKASNSIPNEAADPS